MTVAAQPLPLAPPLPSKGWFNLTPINQRRLDNFRKNRRGHIAFWLFLALFGLSLFAEFIANDRPIIARYKGEFLYPIFKSYPEEKFGGFLATTDYRDPVISKEIEAHGWAIWPPIRFSYRTHNLDLPVPAPAAPTWRLKDEQCRVIAERQGGKGCRDIEWNWLGTDDQGRDVVARLIYGFRISVLFGLILASISSVIGIAAGAIQGYFGGWTDLLFQRFIEIWTSIPALYLLIIVSAVITPSFFVLLGILLLFSWVALVGVVRAEFLRARNLEYVRAARALGLSNGTIMVKHL
ncbi:MAG: ABC transporter permease subunit, partial [Bosea sp. (in: a-proteobacteria)]